MISIFVILFVLSSSAQFMVWVYLVERLFKHQHQYSNMESGVSVIIAAKNEAAALAENLPVILDQVYDDFEVIVVDDHSTDQTPLVLKSLQEKYGQKLVIHLLPHQESGKKVALIAGAAQARFQELLLTDADCQPSSPHWISCMTQPLKAGKKIVLGAAPVVAASGIASHFHTYDVMYTTVLFLSFASKGMPYMGVGRNLAYQAEIIKNLPDHYFEDLSGDDDLLVNHAATSDNTAIVASPSALMISPAVSNWSAFIRQKIRHFSVSHRYKNSHKFILALIALSHWMFLVSSMVLLFTPWGSTVAVVYLLRLSIIYRKTIFPFRQISRLSPIWMPGFDLMYLLYHPLTLILLTLRPQYQWR